MDKLLKLSTLQNVLEQHKANGKRIIWTNGCYDLLHAGHVLYLKKAKTFGDVLVVGLNSDASVRATKGPLRPIVDEQQRATVITALECVDFVIIFNDDSPIKLIDILKPDVYAKGGDYTVDTINQQERKLVDDYGGDIALIPGMEGMSTTRLIDRILQAYQT